MSRNIAIILAGGVGNRTGLKQPKQFLEFAGKTVLEHSIAAFEQHEDIHEIAVITNANFIEQTQQLLQKNHWKKVKKILPGGKERSDSSLAAIRAYENESGVNLVFHDAARPLVSARIIDHVCQALVNHKAVGVGIGMEAVDTLMEVTDGQLTQMPSRKHLQRMQTPQAFRIDVIVEAYRKAMADPDFQATDDCGVVKRYMPEVPISIVEGDARNIKLTYAADLPKIERYYHEAQAEATKGNTPCSQEQINTRNNATVNGRERYLNAYNKENLREMQLTELDILRHVARICERHCIPYWLDSGTLLGAVRHDGFIPWDDDIDICMPREELPRFIEVAQRELPEHLFVQAPATDPAMRLPICKVRNLNSLLVEGDDNFAMSYAKGLYVDIFPMHAWPSLPYKFSKRLARGYCRANAILHTQHTYSWRSVAELFYFGAKRALFGTVWKICTLLTDNKKYYSNTIDNSGNGNRHLRSTIFPLSTIEFEGERFAAPRDVDAYLRDLFGDYMKLPPENQRSGHAKFFVSRLID